MSHPNNAAKYPNKPSKPSVTSSQQMQEMRDAVIALQKNDERQNKRINALMALNSLKLSVDIRTSSWLEAAKHIGSAYVVAYNKHKEVLGKEAAERALGIQWVFSILTVVTAGSLSWIGLSGIGLSKLVMESIEDAAQAGVGEVFSALAPLYFAPSIGPVGIEPQIFQNNLEANILSMIREIDTVFLKTTNLLQKAKLEQWDHYDEKKQAAWHDAWRKKAAEFSGVEDLPIGSDGKTNVQMMADELERGIWAKYILSERYYRDFGIFKTASEYEYVGRKVCDRLVELGMLTRDEWIKITLAPSGVNQQSAVNAMAERAKGFQPTPFVEMRRKQEKLGAAIKQIARPALKYFGNLRGK